MGQIDPPPGADYDEAMVSRRQFLGAGAAALARAQRAPERPNFILFLLDDHGSHDLGCQGAADVKTPRIDALAASGARFTNWYSNAPVCAPSRAALMTGRVPQRAGVPNNGPPLRPSEQTIASLLKPRGYATGIVGKWHLGSTPETDPNAHGFDSFFGFHSGCIDYFSHRYYWGEPRRVNYHDLWRNRTEIFEDGQYFTDLAAREAKKFIAENRAKPFFLYVPFNAVHYPMHAPKKYVERFPSLDPERRMYAAMLAAADDAIGEIVDTVKQLGLAERTMIFASADNGATREPRAGLNQQPAKGGSNGVFRGNKFSLFDGGMHVAAAMSWPEVVPAGQVIHELGAHMDLLPTICKAAGAALPPDRTIDGRDILPMAASKAKSPHETLYWDSAGQLAVRRGAWKLVKDGFLADGTPEGRKPLTGDDALFLSNLEEDPGETRNRRHDQPKLTDELLSLLLEWQRKASE